MNQGYGPRLVFDINGFQITETVTVTWLIMIVLIAFAFIATRKKFKDVPTGLQNIVELYVEAMEGLVKQTMGEKQAFFTPYIGTLFMFLLVSNTIGLLGIRPPTADVNTTIALSSMTFVIIHTFGFRNQKGRYLLSFFEPVPFMFPLNIIGELAFPVSLGFRLFGNILGGMIIMSLVYAALGWFALVPIPAVLHIYFDVFAGVLQSFIFCMLTMVFVSRSFD